MPIPVDRSLPPPPARPGLQPSASRPNDLQAAKLRATAREFEAVLLGQVVQLMFEGLKDGGPLGGGSAEAQWRDLLAQEYGRAMADSGGIGLAAHVERAMRAALPSAADLPSQELPPRGSEP